MQTGALRNFQRTFPSNLYIPVLQVPTQSNTSRRTKLEFRKKIYLRGPPDPNSFLKYSITVVLSKNLLSWLLKAGSESELILKAPAVLRRKMGAVNEG